VVRIRFCTHHPPRETASTESLTQKLLALTIAA
jgi:hypothetical protein